MQLQATFFDSVLYVGPWALYIFIHHQDGS